MNNYLICLLFFLWIIIMIFLRDDLFCRFLFGKLVYNLRDVGRNFKKGWRVIENDILDLEKCEK